MTKHYRPKHPKVLLTIAVAITLCGSILAIFALMTTSDHSEIVKGHSRSSSGYHTRNWGIFVTGLFTALFGGSRIYLLTRQSNAGVKHLPGTKAAKRVSARKSKA